MTKIALTKRGSHLGGMLVATDEFSRDVLTGVPEGEDVLVTVHKARNIKQLRLFWALATKLADNFDGFDNEKHAARAIKIACHEADMWIMPDTGEIHYEPRSIAFENMDQDHFSRFFKRACYVICERWLTGNTPDELKREVYAMIDGPERASLGDRK